MSNQDLFDKEYVGEAPRTTAPEQKSATKQFLKRPLEPQDLERYGMSKPRRVVVRAKLINGKG